MNYKKSILSVFPIISAIGLTLAFPKFNLWWLAYFALVPVLFSVIKAPPVKRLFYSALFSLVHASGVICWLFIYSVKGAIAGILFSSVIYALFIYSFKYFYRNFPFLKFILYPCLYTFTFFIFSRGALLFGSSLDPAYSQVSNLTIIQIADIFGSWGLTFIIVLINMLVLEIILIKESKKRIFLCGIILIIFTSAYTYGKMKLSSPHKKRAIRVSIIQPNQPVNFNWSKNEVITEVDKIVSLTYAAEGFHPDLLVYPEGTVPYYFGRQHPKQTERIKKAASDLDTHILFGALDSLPTRSGLYPLNSAFLIDNQGKIIDKYAKLVLVPFGEWIPYQDKFPWLEALRVGKGKLFLPGKQGYTVFKHPQAKFSVVICFESMFPWLVQKFVKRGAEAIFVLTNDAAFGKSSEPYQHLASARMRAVENRIGIGFCANSGISALIDPRGRILAQSELFTPAILNGKIYLKSQDSFYAKFGDCFPFLCGIILLVFACKITFKKCRRKKT